MIKKIFSCCAIIIAAALFSQAQTIEAPKGYSPQVGALVSMLDDLKARVTRDVSNLEQEGVDFLLDDDANRIGALIYHLAATEAYYHAYSFENRAWTKEESAKWDKAMNLGDPARAEFVDKPIEYYLKLWDEVREKTKATLMTKDDKWLSKKIPKSTMNNYWAWYHVMEHQANHMGQIRLIAKRIPK